MQIRSCINGHSSTDYDLLEAEHTGYLRLSEPVTHRRAFRLDKSAEKLQITNTLNGSSKHTAEWYFHFDHGTQVQRVDDNLFLASRDDVELRMFVRSEYVVVSDVLDGWISRSYGVKLPAKTLKLSAEFLESCTLVFEASSS